MPQSNARYKPLLFSTTLRNLDRLNYFLPILRDFDGEILDDKLAEKIAGELIRNGVYKPTKRSEAVRRKTENLELLTDQEVTQIMQDNPQNHKEKGFAKGWPSRFDTWFKIAKMLGFVFYNPGERISFSEAGLKLIDTTADESMQEVFQNAFVKFQRNNPFLSVLNDNVPLVLLLDVITMLNSDKRFNAPGVTKLELPLFLYWKDNSADKLYQRICKLRTDYRYNPSREIILDILKEEIMAGKDIERKADSIFIDYVDEFIRKMRLTGLITLRGGGRFIDINKNLEERVNYILDKYRTYSLYTTEEDYFAFASKIDKNLFSFTSKLVTLDQKEEQLVKFVADFGWNTIKSELQILANKKNVGSKHEILRYITAPIRLEFLSALAIKAKFPNINVQPNYPVDDEGIPTSTAPGKGDTGDIECIEGSNGVLVEVTMLGGRPQCTAEVWPITRHLEKFSQNPNTSDVMCYFVAPVIYLDSLRQIEYVNTEEFVDKTADIYIAPITITEFISHLENSVTLFSPA